MNSEFTNSLGIAKSEKDTKVVVAMSGGVDSSTVAGLMKKEGYNAIGVTLKLYDDVKTSIKSRQCCAGQDIMDAKRVANQLNIDHKILYYQKKFRKDVIDNFVESYMAGETPIPCVQCNQTVKFRDLYEYSKELGADALITGHYVNSIHNDGISEMYRAKDHERDQSYFLFNTSRDQLNFLRFPLGKYTKKETRKIAKRLKLNVADKPDSQDICFVPNGDYASVIKKFKPESFKKGNIKDLNDNILGTHEGIINFTIGQRKGIGVTNKEALYVVKINSNNNEIVVGPKSSLKYIGSMITGSGDSSQLGGPIRIAKITGQVAEYGIVPFLSVMAYISISLGLINLFPIPMLDGGHLMFYFFEKILGRPLGQKTQEGFFRIGLFLLFSLMFFATFNDLKDLGLF